LLTIPLSFNEHPKAVANAAVLTPNAPCTPNPSILKNTETTMALSGIPNRFITTDRWLSGKYLERNVPIAGKYIPTHDSNKNRHAMSAPNTEAGDETVDATPPRILDTIGILERIPGALLEMAMVAPPMASVANVNMPTAKFSVEMDLLLPSLSTLDDEVNCPKIVEPSRQHAMKHEKTVPYGVLMAAAAVESFANLEKYALTAFDTAGGQFSTNMYIADSKSDCIAPTSIILGSDLTTFTASRMVGLFPESPELELLLATFSFQRIEEISPPRIRKPTDTSNGPVGPRWDAAKPAI
jgi:hypothetical protein